METRKMFQMTKRQTESKLVEDGTLFPGADLGGGGGLGLREPPPRVSEKNSFKNTQTEKRAPHTVQCLARKDTEL